MKLRLRSLESKETLKIEVPDSCSLEELKETLSRAISSSPSSLHLSLNRKDEIPPSSQNESLHSIGIASGDLIFYTLNPNAFSLETLIHNPEPSQIEPSDPILTQNQPSTEGQAEVGEVDMIDCLPELEQPVVSESMEIAKAPVHTMGKSDSEPSFVMRVLREALGNDRSTGNGHKLVVLAVHAVMLESGFVLLDKVSGMSVGCSYVLNEWTSKASTLSLRYTLTEILANASDAIETVVMKFQSLGHLVNVYGCLSAEGSGLHRVCLDKCKFGSALELMLVNARRNVILNAGRDHVSEVFQLWKMVKDGLALPLSIDLCEKAGLVPPPCFMRLPTDLKLKILELLEGEDIAKVGCVCSEMKYLASNEALWKLKFEGVFGVKIGLLSRAAYKDSYARNYESRKMIPKRPVRDIRHPYVVPSYGLRRDNAPIYLTSFWGGGDYERLTPLGVPPSYRQPGIQIPGHRRCPKFSPFCDFR